jgi:hypothetical protein
MKYDDTAQPPPTSRARELIAVVFAALMVGLISLATFGFGGLLLYEGVILIFRHAYGVELPDPFAWFGVGWFGR